MSLVDNQEKIERYSFSKLRTFQTCKLCYKYTYIDHKRGVGNCFSSYGTLLHSIMERYAKGELELWNLVKTYIKEFNEAVPEPFPPNKFCPNLRELYYEQGLQFLKNFSGYSNAKILGVEEQFSMQIDDFVFTGIIDLIFEDEEGNIVIQDYKSKSSFKSKKEQAEYAMQLYLYATYVIEKFHKSPEKLRFVMFRKNQVVDIPFNQSDYKKSIDWVKSTVKSIRNCWCYPSNYSEFYCNNLCNHRDYCESLKK